MKQLQSVFNQKSILYLIMGNILLGLLMAGCQNLTGPGGQFIDQPTGSGTAESPAAARSVIAPTTTVTPATLTASKSDLPFSAGSLLKSPNDPGVFWLNPDGTRQHIYDWPTFLAFGFKPEEIITVQEDLLADMPLVGELTRLIYDANGWHYWAVNGTLWRIEEWDKVLTGGTYQGVPATPADGLLLNNIPLQLTIPDHVVMRDGDDFYLKRAGEIYHLRQASVYRSYGYSDDEVIEVPLGVLRNIPKHNLVPYLRDKDISPEKADIYEISGGKRYAVSRKQLADDNIPYTSQVPAEFLESFPLAMSLQVVTSGGANLRQGPGTDYEIIGYAPAEATFAPIGRNDDLSWVAIIYEGETVWISSSVVKSSGDLRTLAVETTDAPKAVVAAPTPTPMPATVTSQSITCEEVPIRGFGKVWADHPEIQSYLGCPNTWNGGERGTKAAVQSFEHGLMIWVEQDRIDSSDPVYVLFYDDNTYQRFGDLGAADPAKVGETEAGFYPVGDKFSKVYWEGTGARVKERLGQAITLAADSPGAFQGFWNGRMLWLGEIDRIFVIYDYGYYDDQNNWIRAKVWSSYEDTF